MPIAGLLAALSMIIVEKSNKKTQLLTLMSLILLFVSTNLFPWDRLAAGSSIGRILAQVQLPTRFIGLAAIFLTCLLGELLNRDSFKKNLVYWFYAVFAFSLISASAFTDNY